MIRSMTAFSHREETTENGVLVWELRSVNHRFSEVSLRLPEDLRSLEPKIRERIAGRVKRGKVDASLRFQPQAPEEQPLDLDLKLVAKLAHATRDIDGHLYNAAPINAMDVLRWPGVIQAREADFTLLEEATLALLGSALDELMETRGREGEKLKAVISDRCASMLAHVNEVQGRMPKIIQAQRERLAKRLEELKAELDAERLEQEMAILANKADVDEELERLKAHIEETQRVLETDEPVGRRLDFLTQEMNREANTLGSKSVDTVMTRASVELKVLIEQVREQVQNIE
jgi:uncharacterized protein (TIGR00255 family)